MSQKIELSDGVLHRSIEIDSDGKAVSRLHQPSRDVILERNNELRKNPGALRHGEAMGLELIVPLADYYALKRANPDLFCGDKAIMREAWRKFLASPLADEYRVRERRRCL